MSSSNSLLQQMFGDISYLFSEKELMEEKLQKTIKKQKKSDKGFKEIPQNSKLSDNIFCKKYDEEEDDNEGEDDVEFVEMEADVADVIDLVSEDTVRKMIKKIKVEDEKEKVVEKVVEKV